jgi:LAO/AO transport system kinase
MLKAGILEIGDVFVVNKADMDGAARTVAELEEMIHMRRDPSTNLDTGHHAADGTEGDVGDSARDRSTAGETNGERADGETERQAWTPEVVETVATSGEGIDDLVETLTAHRAYLETSGRLRERARTRYAEEIRSLVQSDVSDLVERELDSRGGVDALAEAVLDRETDPYSVADEVIAPIRECLDGHDDS